jgi:hypothetical protein
MLDSKTPDCFGTLLITGYEPGLLLHNSKLKSIKKIHTYAAAKLSQGNTHTHSNLST